MSKKLYGENFYKSQIDGSYRSAVEYAHHLSNIFTPESVADLGSGRSTWLKAFGECGSTKLVGFDGYWNSQEQMVDQVITYTQTDLNKPLINLKDRFDLAISLALSKIAKLDVFSFFNHLFSIDFKFLFWLKNSIFDRTDFSDKYQGRSAK